MLDLDLVIVISPFRGMGSTEPERQFHQECNAAYARRCMLDSLERGEAPFASHLLYPQVLSEDLADRTLGMACGRRWLTAASLAAVYLDRGYTDGMHWDVKECKRLNILVEYRTFDVDLQDVTLPCDDCGALEGRARARHDGRTHCGVCGLPYSPE